MWEFFEAVLARNEVARAKPHPDGIHAVCQKMGITPAQAFYAGDSAIDAIAAKHAGCKTALVLSGFGTRKILSKEKPDSICKSLLDFARQLPSLK